jgi:hypothetical protein
MPSSEMLRHVALVRTDVSEEPSASIIRVTRFCELGTKLGVTSKRSSLQRSIVSCHSDDGVDTLLRNVSSYMSHRAKHPRRRRST